MLRPLLFAPPPPPLVNMLELCLLSFRIATKSRKEGGEEKVCMGNCFKTKSCTLRKMLTT